MSATTGAGGVTQAIYNTIQTAVTNAAVGSSIDVAAGTNVENITINKRIALVGAGSGSDPLTSTIITSAAANTPVITVTASGQSASERLSVSGARLIGTTGTAGNNTAGINFNLSAGDYQFHTFHNIAAVHNLGPGIVFNGNSKGPHRVQVFGNIGYAQYMTELEAAHFALDAYPFGGYNTAVDLLTLRRPIVTLEGNRFYNRSTAYLLRRLGLDELIAATPEEYIDLSVRMIDDVGFRDRMIRRLKIADLATTVLSHEHVPAFVRAIDHLLDHHDALATQPGREPIQIA